MNLTLSLPKIRRTLKERDQQAIGKKFLGLEKALAASSRVVKEVPYQLLGAGAEDHPSLRSLCGKDARIVQAARRSYRW